MDGMMSLDEIFGSFVSWKYDEHTWFITCMNGSMYLYLLEGEDYALLIDTAYGLGDLRSFVSKLTDKPIIVVNTHGHLDHAGGNGQWEKVFMHKNAVIDHQTFEGGPCDISKLPHPDYEKVFIEEGYVFDLGGRKIEVIDISSHSNGSLSFIDESRKLIYAGDEIESTQVLMYEIVESGTYNFGDRIKKHISNMKKLKKNSDKFDFLCPAHNGAPISKKYIDDFIGLGESILDGTVTVENKLNHKFIEASPEGKLLCRVRYENASFFVRKSDLEGLK